MQDRPRCSSTASVTYHGTDGVDYFVHLRIFDVILHPTFDFYSSDHMVRSQHYNHSQFFSFKNYPNGAQVRD